MCGLFYFVVPYFYIFIFIILLYSIPSSLLPCCSSKMIQDSWVYLLPCACRHTPALALWPVPRHCLSPPPACLPAHHPPYPLYHLPKEKKREEEERKRRHFGQVWWVVWFSLLHTSHSSGGFPSPCHLPTILPALPTISPGQDGYLHALCFFYSPYYLHCCGSYYRLPLLPLPHPWWVVQVVC